jgi:transposase-like protein
MGRSTEEILLSEKKKYRTWTVQQKLEIVLAELRGEEVVAEICREHQISKTLFCTWREKPLEGGGARSRSRAAPNACPARRSAPTGPHTLKNFPLAIVRNTSWQSSST